MRVLTDHIVGELNEKISIAVVDDPSEGGANHLYQIWANGALMSTLAFQKGPVKEKGINGISGEALLAVVIDRLRSFQSGPFACRENAVALTELESSLMWLQRRTRDRIARNVEGYNKQ